LYSIRENKLRKYSNRCLKWVQRWWSLLPPEDSSRYGPSLVQRSDRTIWYDIKAVVTIRTLVNENNWCWRPQFHGRSRKCY